MKDWDQYLKKVFGNIEIQTNTFYCNHQEGVLVKLLDYDAEHALKVWGKLEDIEIEDWNSWIERINNGR